MICQTTAKTPVNYRQVFDDSEHEHPSRSNASKSLLPALFPHEQLLCRAI